MAVIALRMLFGDRAKYLGLIFGVAFSTLLIAQQGGLFVGLMLRTASVIDDAQEVNIWVMDPQAGYIDTVRALRDTELPRVRGVAGVDWAVQLAALAAARARYDEARTVADDQNEQLARNGRLNTLGGTAAIS